MGVGVNMLATVAGGKAVGCGPEAALPATNRSVAHRMDAMPASGYPARTYVRFPPPSSVVPTAQRLAQAPTTRSKGANAPTTGSGGAHM